jgi:hypothetical protein
MWTAFGVGGAGLATGIVAGTLALDEQAALDRVCQNATCPPEAEPDLHDYHRLRTVSFVGYVVGFLGAATGFVWLATRPKETRATGATASVSVWPSGVAVSGAF